MEYGTAVYLIDNDGTLEGFVVRDSDSEVIVQWDNGERTSCDGKLFDQNANRGRFRYYGER